MAQPTNMPSTFHGRGGGGGGGGGGEEMSSDWRELGHMCHYIYYILIGLILIPSTVMRILHLR